MEELSTRDDAATELPPPAAGLHSRPRHIWKPVLLSIVCLLAILSGIWFLGVRPSLQHQAVLQIDRALNIVVVTGEQYLSVYPSGPRNFLMSDKSISHALTFHNAYDSDTWQMTVTPANITITVSFAGCGQHCTFTAVLTIVNSPFHYSQIQVIYAHAQGLLALIMSDDELANVLNNNVRITNWIPMVMSMKITLLKHAIYIQTYQRR